MAVSHCSKVAVVIMNEKKKNHAILKTTSCSRIWACGLHVDREEQVCQRHTELIEQLAKWKNNHINHIQIFMGQF